MPPVVHGGRAGGLDGVDRHVATEPAGDRDGADGLRSATHGDDQRVQLGRLLEQLE